MNYIKNNYKGNNQIKYCQCESEIKKNKHLYECNWLNNTEKKISMNHYLTEDCVN